MACQFMSERSLSKHLWPGFTTEKTVDGGRPTHRWNFQFRRSLNDWEVDTLVELFRTLEEFEDTKEDPDRL